MESTDYLTSTTHQNTDINNGFMEILSPLIERELEKNIATLTNTKLEGYDGLSTRIIKACSNVISPKLTHFVNLLFTSRTFQKN